jgi:formylglycine-generating enzyme required for sulfatase activity
MHGNIWEWVNDWYAEDYYKNSPQDNPTGPEKGVDRVLRGGSWINYPTFVRSAIRNRVDPAYRFDNVGFRLARTP